MIRAAIHAIVLLMMILQGVVQVSANAAEVPTSHCIGHEANADDCACCSDAAMAQSGCAAVCVVAAAIPSHSLALSHCSIGAPSSILTTVRVDPAYLPLNPPPIS